MQTMPSPGSQRGSIRPPARDTGVAPRPAGPPVRRPGSMDGVVKVAKTEVSPVVAPPTPAPTVAPAPAAPVLSEAAPTPAKEAPSLESKLEAELAKPEDTKLDRKARRAQKRAAKQEAQGPMGNGRRFERKRFFLIAIAIIVLLVTAYIAYDTWMANSRAQAVLTNQANASTNPSDWAKEDEGQDESEPQANALDSYVVEASMPRALYIDKLDVAARVMPMSVNTDGSIQAPKNIFDSGWYNGSVKPGETGAMFIDGHASGPTRQGLFAYLDTLTEGDELQVEKGDGEKLTYRVVHVETVPLSDVDMRKVLLPYENASKALNLMTCTGKWLPLEKTYDHRVIVYTEQV